jgi:hypothetical protein
MKLKISDEKVKRLSGTTLEVQDASRLQQTMLY